MVHYTVLKGGKNLLFYSVIIMMVLIRVATFSYGTSFRFSPYDDNLYINLAYDFMSGKDWLNYNGFPLLKTFGFPFVLATLGYANIKYQFFLNSAYVVSILYFLYVIRSFFNHRLFVCIAIFIGLFNPYTYSDDWYYLLREPLSAVLDIFLVSTLIMCVTARKPVTLALNLMGFVFAFVIALFLREESILLFYFFIISVLTFITVSYVKSKHVSPILIVLLVSITSIYIGANKIYSNYVEKKYEVAITHEMSDGEFPVFLSNLRRISVGRQNSYALIKWSAMDELSKKSKEFDEIFKRLPAPSQMTLSCSRLGVCNEWSYGFLSFWLLSAASEAGYDTEAKRQALFKSINTQITLFCNDHLLVCEKANGRLLPNFNIKWLDRYLIESYRIITLLIRPNFQLAESSPSGFNNEELLDKYELVLNDSTVGTELSSISTIERFYLKIVFMIWQIVCSALIVCSMLLLTFEQIKYPRQVLSGADGVIILFYVYMIIRLLALAYVACFMGSYDSRMIASFYSFLLIVAVPKINALIVKRNEFNAT